VSSGSTCGPSIVSLSLRRGWSMGEVQDRYLRYEAAGDQYCGRIVSGLQVHSSKFAVLPPHFLDPIDSKVSLAVFPQLSLHEKLKALLENSIASVLYHLEWLRRPFFKETKKNTI
jgi:hypothetical protein